MSFGYADVDLSGPGFILVSGRNENVEDMASSNGSGKSSIWEAISWVLTGNTIRGCKNVTNSNGDDGALVELTCKIDGKEYIITRTKDHSKLKSSLKILVDGIDKSGKGIRDSEKLLAEYLPDLTPSLIGSVIILGQGLPQRFTSNTPSGRKEVLEKLSNSDFMVEDIKNRISKRIESFTEDKKALEIEQVKLTTQKNVLVAETAEARKKYEQLDNKSEYEASLAVIDCDIEQITKDKTDVEKVILDYKELLETYNNQYLSATNEKFSTTEKIKNSYQQDIDKYREERAASSARITQLKSTIAQKESITDICPTCGQKLPNVEKIDTTEDKALLAQEKANYEELNNLYNNTLIARDTEVDEYVKSVESSINKAHNDALDIKDLLREKDSELRSINEHLKGLATKKASIQSKIEAYDSQVEYLINKIEVNDEKIHSLDEEILYNDSVIKDKNSHLEVLNKFNTAIKREFRGILLENVIAFLNKKAKDYCNDVLNHSNIQFELDGNNISITVNGKEYEQLSGGEKQKLDIIIQLAIRDMLCKYMDFSSNIFVLDEIFDNLDDTGSEKILNLISQRLEDVSSIYIVTHHSSIQIPVDRELLIVKDSNGISRIEL